MKWHKGLPAVDGYAILPQAQYFGGDRGHQTVYQSRELYFGGCVARRWVAEL